jgi:hypothetical protein
MVPSTVEPIDIDPIDSDQIEVAPRRAVLEFA